MDTEIRVVLGLTDTSKASRRCAGVRTLPRLSVFNTMEVLSINDVAIRLRHLRCHSDQTALAVTLTEPYSMTPALMDTEIRVGLGLTDTLLETSLCHPGSTLRNVMTALLWTPLMPVTFVYFFSAHSRLTVELTFR